MKLLLRGVAEKGKRIYRIAGKKMKVKVLIVKVKVPLQDVTGGGKNK